MIFGPAVVLLLFDLLLRQASLALLVGGDLQQCKNHTHRLAGPS